MVRDIVIHSTDLDDPGNPAAVFSGPERREVVHIYQSPLWAHHQQKRATRVISHESLHHALSQIGPNSPLLDPLLGREIDSAYAPLSNRNWRAWLNAHLEATDESGMHSPEALELLRLRRLQRLSR